MSGFRKVARFVDSCERAFFARFRWLLRKKQSKGHGVHSPFAFNLIRNVIHSPYSFYAFSDIDEIVSQNNINPECITAFNYLSFRLVHFLQARDILEINSGIGINSLFLTAPSTNISCRCVEEDEEKVAVAAYLLQQAGRKFEIFSTIAPCKNRCYDAIFINLTKSTIPDIETLLEISHPSTFWVVHPIKRGMGKQFWNEIVHDVRVRVTFDVKDIGIAFLSPDLSKANYLV